MCLVVEIFSVPLFSSLSLFLFSSCLPLRPANVHVPEGFISPSQNSMNTSQPIGPSKGEWNLKKKKNKIKKCEICGLIGYSSITTHSRIYWIELVFKSQASPKHRSFVRNGRGTASASVPKAPPPWRPLLACPTPCPNPGLRKEAAMSGSQARGWARPIWPASLSLASSKRV